MIPFVLTAAAAVAVTVLLIGLFWAAAKLSGMALAKSPAEHLNEALSHPEPVNRTPVEIVRDALVPKPLSDEEHRFAFETAKKLAGQVPNPPPTSPWPTPTATPAGSGTGSPPGVSLEDLERLKINPK